MNNGRKPTHNDKMQNAIISVITCAGRQPQQWPTARAIKRHGKKLNANHHINTKARPQTVNGEWSSEQIAIPT